MKIEKVEIKNFGKLQNFSISLSDGFNLVYGQNEDGKSTLMAFLKMMFYGSSSRGTDLTKNPRKKYAPWNGKNMAGSIEFENDGICYRIEKVFGASKRTDRVQLLNLATGEPEQIASEDEIGQKFFGMGMSAFEKSVFIGQIGSVINNDGDKEDEITQKLLNLVSVGDESVSMKKVMSRLQAAKESLRSKSGRTGTSVELEQNLSSLQDERKEALDTEERKDQLSKQIAELTKKKKEYEDAIRKNQACYDQQKELDLLDKLNILLSEMHSRDLEIGALRSGDLIVDTDFLEKCQDRMNKIHEQKVLLNDKTKSKKQIDKEIADLKSVPIEEVPDKYVEQIRNQGKEQIKLEKSRETLNNILRSQNELNQLLQQKQKNAEPMRHISEHSASLHVRKTKHLPLLIFSLILLVFSVICGIFVQPACLVGIVVAVLMGILAWKMGNGDTENRGNSGSQSIESSDFLEQRIYEVKKELEALGVVPASNQDIAQTKSRLDKLAAAETELHNTIEKLLSQKNCKTFDELHDKQIKWQNYLTRLNANDNNRKKAQDEEEEARNALQQLENELLRTIRPFVFASTTDEANNAITKWRTALGKLQIMNAEIDRRKEGLPSEMQKVPVEKLKQAANALHDELLKECNGALPAKCDTLKVNELKQQSDAYRLQSQDCEKKLIESNVDIRNQFGEKKSVSEIDNEIAHFQHKLNDQKYYYECLNIAQQELEAAFQEISQNFSPVLNKKAATVFHGLTGEKYQDITISKDFDIKVQQAGDPVSHEWQYLSNGTIEQAYFSLRMALSDLLCQNGQRLPLLLDDVFEQYDDQRAERGLKFLVDYVNSSEKKTQIIFFTCHLHFVEHLKKLNSQITILNL